MSSPVDQSEAWSMCSSGLASQKDVLTVFAIVGGPVGAEVPIAVSASYIIHPDWSASLLSSI